MPESYDDDDKKGGPYIEIIYSLKNTEFWDVPLCSPVDVQQFRGTLVEFSRLYIVTSQKITCFTVTAVKNYF
jgi:hypothetical protein